MFSIITPTYNRAEILARCLHVFFEMEGIAECEVIVVDDGSTDRTTVVLEEFKTKYPALFRFLQQENGGPGVARNTGIKAASKEYILFLDDDVLPDKGLLKAHQLFLSKGFDVSQGVLYWHPEIENDLVLRFMDRRGMQFAFDRIESVENLSYLYVYTANLALTKRDVLKHGAFDDKLAVKRYAYEDTAFAYSLHKSGANIGLNREARAYHYHPMTANQVVERAYKTGYGFGVLEDEYPEIARAMNLTNKMAGAGMQHTLLSLLLKFPFLENLAGFDMFLRLRCRRAFVSGLREYRNEKG